VVVPEDVRIPAERALRRMFEVEEATKGQDAPQDKVAPCE
jgi:hypothetical protein